MSVDVWIGDWDGGYTNNVSKLWHDHLSDGNNTGLVVLHGKTGEQAFHLMRDAFERIHKTKVNFWKEGVVGEPEFCAQYDAPNGWGSTVGALIFMAEVMAACAAHPRDMVKVYV